MLLWILCVCCTKDFILYRVFQALKQESGWCSGYHARFTRERSRVRTSHPIFFYFLFYCYSRFLAFQKTEVVSTHNENHKSSLVIVSSPQFGRTFSAVWLRSSVVSVLFSVKTENVPTGYIFFTCIFRLGRQ